jgi:hypothetical protein
LSRFAEEGSVNVTGPVVLRTRSIAGFGGAAATCGPTCNLHVLDDVQVASMREIELPHIVDLQRFDIAPISFTVVFEMTLDRSSTRSPKVQFSNQA